MVANGYALGPLQKLPSYLVPVPVTKMRCNSWNGPSTPPELMSTLFAPRAILIMSPRADTEPWWYDKKPQSKQLHGCERCYSRCSDRSPPQNRNVLQPLMPSAESHNDKIWSCSSTAVCARVPLVPCYCQVMPTIQQQPGSQNEWSKHQALRKKASGSVWTTCSHTSWRGKLPAVSSCITSEQSLPRSTHRKRQPRSRRDLNDMLTAKRKMCVC